MNRYITPVILVISAIGLSGCFDGGGNSGSNDGDGDTSSEGVGFTGFVKQTLEIDEDREPRSVTDVDFRFDDLENPDAYDDVIDDGM